MLEGDISTLVRDVDDLEEEVLTLRRQLAEVHAVLEQARSMHVCMSVHSICVVNL